MPLAAAALLVAGISACGGTGSSSSSASPTPAAVKPVGTAGVNLGRASAQVAATNALRFSPASVHVSVGGIVEWQNTGSVMHTVTFVSHPQLSDSALQPGATWEVRFLVPGTYRYQCTIHAGMIGTVVVSG